MKTNYKEMVKSFTDQDYEPTHEFYTIEQCCGSVGLASSGGMLSNPVKAIQNVSNERIYFTRKGVDVIPFYYAKQNKDSTFQMYELTYEAYCKYGF